MLVVRPLTLRLALLVALMGIVACGNANPSTSESTAASGTAPSSLAATAEASATTARPASTLASAPATGSSAEGYAALPQSKTPEGYYVLGDPNAPVSITFYSDFI